MMLAGLEEESRRPYVIEAGGEAVGVLTLQSGAARLAGWPDDDSAWLLRGFLIDRRRQGRGLGTAAAAAAVATAAKLTAQARQAARPASCFPSTNATPPGLAAYRKAGFEDAGSTSAATPARSGPCTPRSEPDAAVSSGGTGHANHCVGTRCVPTLCLGSVLQTLLGGRLERVFVSGTLAGKAGSSVSARLEPASAFCPGAVSSTAV